MGSQVKNKEPKASPFVLLARLGIQNEQRENLILLFKMGLHGFLTTFLPIFYFCSTIMTIILFKFYCNMFQNLASPGISNKNHYSTERKKREGRMILRGSYCRGPGEIILARKMKIILVVEVSRYKKCFNVYELL